ncbi:MAG: glucose-6-phosphate isomerase, partial [Ruminococcaceae bacterium]|nr:glucose-6-phosphate isomerase [Oscillospiraceae bacterium]
MNKPLSLNTKFTENFVSAHEFEAMKPFVSAADKLIKNRNGLGNDFLGWLDLPVNYDKDEFDRVKKAAEKIRNDSDILVVIGIGGSYLGARAVIEFCAPVFGTEKTKSPEILFLGNNLSPAHMVEVLNKCKGKRVSVNVISKSGTTTEPALAFRVMKDYLEKEYGESAKDRIYATTDKARGTLKNLSVEKGYETFVIPDDVGGRFSVLTPVGLLPIAVAGLDIDALMSGAQQARTDFDNDDLDNNDCYKYATMRSIMLRKGKTTEVTVGYEPFIASFCEWIKQLHGESEGKDNKGLFPASMIFSTDLHSLGQYVQQCLRNLFE